VPRLGGRPRRSPTATAPGTRPGDSPQHVVPRVVVVGQEPWVGSIRTSVRPCDASRCCAASAPVRPEETPYFEYRAKVDFTISVASPGEQDRRPDIQPILHHRLIVPFVSIATVPLEDNQASPPFTRFPGCS